MHKSSSAGQEEEMGIKVKPQNHRIKEFRIVLPMSVENYHVGQLWSVAEASKAETGAGDGVEVIRNEPFNLEDVSANKKYVVPQIDLLANGVNYTKGQYTFKKFFLEKKMPKFIQKIAPKGSLELCEEAWNCYPYCRTIITNKYMKMNMYISIETMHFADAGTTENIHNLKDRDLKERVVELIDIANAKVTAKDYHEDQDPCLVAAPLSGRPTPLPRDGNVNWMKTQQPVMCCYKLVKVWFKWFGIQSKIETYIIDSQQRIFTNFHRQVVCWQDRYHGLTMEDIRRLEEQTRLELERQRREGPARGTVGDEG